MRARPLGQRVVGHAHRTQRLGIADEGLGGDHFGQEQAGCIADVRGGHPLVQNGDRDERHGAPERQPEEIGMDHPEKRDEKRRKRQIEQGEDTARSDERPDRGEIAHRLDIAKRSARRLHRRLHGPAAVGDVKTGCNPAGDNHAHRFQNAEKQQGGGGKNRKIDQRVGAGRRQDPVIDLQQEQRRGQQKRVHTERKHPYLQNCPAKPCLLRRHEMFPACPSMSRYSTGNRLLLR